LTIASLQENTAIAVAMSSAPRVLSDNAIPIPPPFASRLYVIGKFAASRFPSDFSARKCRRLPLTVAQPKVAIVCRCSRMRLESLRCAHMQSCLQRS
jgi:hypothetical protein